MRLIVETGPDAGSETEVKLETVAIGRLPDNDLVLADEETSSRHAVLEPAGHGTYTLRDLKSTNGTFVDGERLVVPRPMTGGERIEIGRNMLLLSVGDQRTVVHTSPTVADLSPPFMPTTPVPSVPSAEDAVGTSAAMPVERDGRAASQPPRPPRGDAASPRATGSGEPVAHQPRRVPVVALVSAAGVIAVLALALVIVLTTQKASHHTPSKAVRAAKESAPVRPLTTQQVISDATPSVVRIQGDQGGGSGFVIDAARQLVLTNAHVAVGNDAMKAQVGNDPSTETPIQLVAASPCDDLAVVRLVNPVNGLKALPLGDSNSVHAGDQVIVLGFPGSFQATAPGQLQQASTENANIGSVSAVHVQATPDPSLPTYQDTIQHQAPTNHGNSGGPLLNRQGQVIGINTLGNPDAQGQYYSISIDYARRILPDLERGKSKGLIGWSLMPLAAGDANLTDELRSIYQDDPTFAPQAAQLANSVAGWMRQNPPTSGLYNSDNAPGSAADKAQWFPGNLLTSINGDPVTSVQNVCDVVNGASPGSLLQLSGYNLDAASNVDDITKSYRVRLRVPN